MTKTIFSFVRNKVTDANKIIENEPDEGER